MKKISLWCILAFLCLACAENKNILTVTVTNPLAADRAGEMVEVSMIEVSDLLRLADTAQLVVLGKDGEQIPYQITYDGKLIFPVTVDAGATASYTIEPGIPADVEVKSCGRQYPERDDDMAWENDLVGFRAYGPALQARGEKGFGYDLFTKHNTTEPILEKLYADELNPESWKNVEELRKTDGKAADELMKTFSYHVDHGYGMDCYAVGSTLGAGTAALAANDTILYPWCYRTGEVLDNGPLRFTVRLVFNPLVVRDDTTVVETRVIALDAGSHLNRTAVSYTGLKETMPVVTGIVLHEPDGQITTSAEGGYMTYVDPTTGPDNGKILVGAAFPAEVASMKAVLFSPEEKRMRNADGHLLAKGSYEPGSEYVYYWGFAWDRADIQTPEAWNHYMADFVRRLRNPLKIEIR